MSEITETTPARSGLRLTLAATAVAGILGFVIQIGMGGVLGKTPAYTSFMAFWAAFYLVVGAIAGVQQEYARAVAHTQRTPSMRETGVGARRFALLCAAIVAAVLGLSGLLWGPHVFSHDWGTAIILIALGGGAYVLFSAVNGNLYGRERWNLIAVGIIGDPLIRLVLLALVLVLWPGIENGLRIAVVVPVLLTVIILEVWGRGAGFGQTRLGLPGTQIGWNILRTVGGAVSTAALISGYPLFLTIVAGANPALPGLIYVFTLVRAPIVIPMLALQNFMIVHFGKNPRRALGTALRLMGGVILGAIVLGAAAAWVGPWVISLVSAGQFDPSPWLVGAMVASAGATGALCVSGAAAVALNRHTGFLLGWVVAALASVLLLLLPGAIEQRALIALTVGPVLGLIVHLATLRRASRESAPAFPNTPSDKDDDAGAGAGEGAR
ncbi:hypothetical protein D9V32_07525 [Mycetocola tolaasinivorans]|uniref:Polysaccharide biosynthesis protein n=1 Tax=Mycetocola tolaasinivorans TaxID=76635 RepID=A0A3L7A808_9MICO|nr:hypothetical protein [Mycetocola tolaasinivorans]RLP75998.1 hypothetical protein D9V32_07525 [Mycetocola tolaasinivorans]